MSDENKKFNIQLASQLSGVSAHTIRAWEKRYKALTPSRSDNGRRLYTANEIDRLIMLAQLTQFGTNISQIAKLTDSELKETYHKLVQTSQISIRMPVQSENLNINETQVRLLEAVGRYQVDIISQLLSQAKNTLMPRAFALEIMDPLIREVKRRCERQEFKDAQAQALFAIARFHAGNIIYSHFEKSPKSTSKIVLTSVEKEHHTFPLLISALLCCHHKKNFFYLNSNLPCQSIIDAVYATEANLLMLSIPPRSHEDPMVLELLDEVINVLSTKIKIWLIGDFLGDDEKLQLRWKNTRFIKGHVELDEFLQANA